MESFRCLRCGRCCFEIPSATIEEHDKKAHAYKRIPVYPEEADKLEDLARRLGIELHLIEDLVFPDIKNQRILVLTYRILLTENNHCPFYEKEVGCRIHTNKPLSCQAYPLALQSSDAFHVKIEIDPLCTFTELHRDHLEGIGYEQFIEIYEKEYKLARNLLQRNKRAIMQLKGLEALGEVEIPRHIDPVEYSRILNEWNRVIVYEDGLRDESRQGKSK